MKSTKNNLLKLQEIDTRLNDLKQHRGDLPQIIDDLTKTIQEKEEYVAGCEAAIIGLQSDRETFNQNLEENIQRLKVFEEKLYEVKNNKEYDQIQLEIETRKMEISELENKIFSTEEEEEKLKEDINLVREELKGLVEEKEKRVEELKDIDEFVKEEEEKLLKEREQIVGIIDDRFVNQYERIKNAKKGLAVAVITETGACSGCYSIIPSQRVVEIRSKNQIFTCEYCGRILIWEEEE
ncbi:MAG: C4-type zinc ribbon domain-containing protein [Calditrichia bacterium]